MRNLRGANAVVTGGSRGIGPHMARALAAEGVNVALAARDAARLEAMREEVEKLGVRAVAVPADLRLPEDRSRLVERANTQLGSVDVLINNAGVESAGEFARLETAEIEGAITTNLTACLLLMRMVLPGMVERRRGHVVNIASLAGKVAVPYGSVYTATKFGLVGFTHAVREELRGSGVGVSVVCPGYVSDAGMYADTVNETGMQAPAIVGTSKPEKVAAAVVRAIRRDVAEAIVTPFSARPAMVLSAVAPTAGMALLRAFGAINLSRQVAERLNANK